jgi:hypothetical protein
MCKAVTIHILVDVDKHIGLMPVHLVRTKIDAIYTFIIYTFVVGKV